MTNLRGSGIATRRVSTFAEAVEVGIPVQNVARLVSYRVGRNEEYVGPKNESESAKCTDSIKSEISNVSDLTPSRGTTDERISENSCIADPANDVAKDTDNDSEDFWICEVHFFQSSDFSDNA